MYTVTLAEQVKQASCEQWHCIYNIHIMDGGGGGGGGSGGV